jgi:hypothetical protein
MQMNFSEKHRTARSRRQDARDKLRTTPGAKFRVQCKIYDYMLHN